MKIAIWSEHEEFQSQRTCAERDRVILKLPVQVHCNYAATVYYYSNGDAADVKVMRCSVERVVSRVSENVVEFMKKGLL